MIMGKIIEVKVKPNSRQSKIETNDQGGLVAFVKAQPVDGKANAELISLLAGHFQIHKWLESLEHIGWLEWDSLWEMIYRSTALA